MVKEKKMSKMLGVHEALGKDDNEQSSSESEMKDGTTELLGIHQDAESLKKLREDVEELPRETSVVEAGDDEAVERIKRAKETENNKDTLKQIKRELVSRLLNVKTMKQRSIGAVEFAQIVGMSESRAYYYLSKFGFSFRNRVQNSKEPNEIMDLVWSSLTGAEIERLYKWIAETNFPEESLHDNTREIVISDRKINKDSNIRVVINDLNLELTGDEIHLDKKDDEIVIKSKNTKISY